MECQPQTPEFKIDPETFTQADQSLPDLQIKVSK